MRSRTVEAVYEQGVLRPLEQLDLREHALVEVTIREATRAGAQKSGSCHDLAAVAGMIGALQGAPDDLSSNQEHLAGFGTK